MSEIISVIDTETTWDNKLMSVGVVLANASTFEPVGKRYYIILPEKYNGGMYSDVLYIGNVRPDLECSYANAVDDILGYLSDNHVQKIFAYNAAFDMACLPRLSVFEWFDIMKIAAYRQYNRAIPPYADCYKTGKLKRGFGVESIFRMLSGDSSYYETHNALIDAFDELSIMKMLCLDIDRYKSAKM